MAAFFRGLLLFLFGAIVGAGGILFFTPSFNVVVSRSPGAAKPIEVAAAPAPVAVPAVAATTKAAAPAPAPTAVAVAPATVAPATVVPSAPVADEPTIDFKSISEHLILWPTTVTVKAATTVPLMADGKKVQDLALDAGTVLQLSKVLTDGSLEVRAKGAKFEIKSALTDFSVELGKRVSELVAKGAKIDSPFAATPPSTAPVAASAPVASTLVTTAPVVSVAAATPWVRLTLAQRVDVLFGNKPDTVVPAATVAPVTTSPAAPAATPAPATVAPVTPVVEAAPAADPKAAEKGKDLDRKLNQLFK
ncbi:MAG: hypothetical protein ORN22_05455 [Opitutales bacterium]|nr:hypothetical protein [Opitutales bacterium]